MAELCSPSCQSDAIEDLLDIINFPKFCAEYAVTENECIAILNIMGRSLLVLIHSKVQPNFYTSNQVLLLEQQFEVIHRHSNTFNKQFTKF